MCIVIDFVDLVGEPGGWRSGQGLQAASLDCTCYVMLYAKHLGCNVNRVYFLADLGNVITV